MAKRGRPKKIKLIKSETNAGIQISNFANPVKTRLQELQELYEILKRENITSISKLEAMISQLQSEA